MVIRTLTPTLDADDFVRTPETTTDEHSLGDPWRRQRSAPAELWHPWASRMWPCTTVEERRFVDHLERMHDDDTERFERRDVTALVTALRSGLTADELFERARGLRPARLLAAHRSLERRRAAAEGAWCTIVDDPTRETFDHHADDAAAVVPVVISHLTAVALRHPRAFARAVDEAAAQIERTSHSVALLEEQLDRCIPPSDRGVEIGALLYDRRGEGAWSLGTFLPSRVGQLIPLRVAALLGEGRPVARASGW